jgi:hypothetical protein
MFHLYRRRCGLRLRAAVATATATASVWALASILRAAVAVFGWSAPACKYGGRGGRGRLRSATAAVRASMENF